MYNQKYLKYKTKNIKILGGSKEVINIIFSRDDLLFIRCLTNFENEMEQLNFGKKMSSVTMIGHNELPFCGNGYIFGAIEENFCENIICVYDCGSGYDKENLSCDKITMDKDRGQVSNLNELITKIETTNEHIPGFKMRHYNELICKNINYDMIKYIYICKYNSHGSFNTYFVNSDTYMKDRILSSIKFQKYVYERYGKILPIVEYEPQENRLNVITRNIVPDDITDKIREFKVFDRMEKYIYNLSKFFGEFKNIKQFINPVEDIKLIIGDICRISNIYFSDIEVIVRYGDEILSWNCDDLYEFIKRDKERYLHIIPEHIYNKYNIDKKKYVYDDLDYDYEMEQQINRGEIFDISLFQDENDERIIDMILHDYYIRDIPVYLEKLKSKILIFRNKTEEELYLMTKHEKQESLEYFFKLCE